MTTRTRLIEGTWGCSSCGSKDIQGRHKVCPTCNNPREEGSESQFDFGATDAATGKSLREGVTDEKAAALGALGADWYCPFCAAGNREDAEKCRGCQAPKPENPPRTPPPPKPPEPPPSKSGRGKLIAAAVVLGLLAMCGFAFRTKDSGGQVTGLHWKRTAERQAFKQVEASGWRADLVERPVVMPVNGAGEQAGISDIRDCQLRENPAHKIPDGTEEVCRTKTRKVQCGSEEKCTRKDKGNGFAEETCRDIPKYCDESYEDCQVETRYRNSRDPWCTYTTWKWSTVDEKSLEGNDGAPRWPELQVGGAERLQRTEAYTVDVSWKDGKERHSEELKSEAEFARFKVGSPVVVTSNGLGVITSVKPAP